MDDILGNLIVGLVVFALAMAALAMAVTFWYVTLPLTIVGVVLVLGAKYQRRRAPAARQALKEHRIEEKSGSKLQAAQQVQPHPEGGTGLVCFICGRLPSAQCADCERFICGEHTHFTHCVRVSAGWIGLIAPKEKCHYRTVCPNDNFIRTHYDEE
jgi:membrane protein implicated in regulation of membrane protease activity